MNLAQKAGLKTSNQPYMAANQTLNDRQVSADSLEEAPPAFCEWFDMSGLSPNESTFWGGGGGGSILPQNENAI